VVRSTEAGFVDLVDSFLHDHRADGDLEEPTILSADLGAAKTLPGTMKVEPKLTLYFSTTAIYRGFSQLEMAGRLIRFMRKHGLRFRNDVFRLDAGSVVVDGGAVLLLGGGNHRVAALTAKLVAGGATLLGDDATIWEPVDRLVYPVGMPITMDADLAHDSFPELVPPVRRRVRVRRDQSEVPHMWPVPIRPEDLGSAAADGPAPIRNVFVVDIHEGGPTTVEPIGLAEAVFAASRSVANLEIWGERGLIAFRELYEQVPFMRLSTSSIDEGADAVRQNLMHMDGVA
jgi:hypothetical protein